MQVSLISITTFRFHMFVLTLQHSPLSNFLNYCLVFTIYTTQCSFDGSVTYEHAHKRFRNKFSRSESRMLQGCSIKTHSALINWSASGKDGSNNGDSSAPQRMDKRGRVGISLRKGDRGLYKKHVKIRLRWNQPGQPPPSPSPRFPKKIKTDLVQETLENLRQSFG